MTFTGEFNNSIDVKGRASIPARFREILQAGGDESLVVTKSPRALTAYPLSAWQKMLEKVHAMPNGVTKNDITRNRIAPAAECAFDKQGRIQLPQSLRHHAGLDKEIVVVGLFDKIEIWSQLRHAEETDQTEERLQEQSELLAELGF